jgi:hypothetical protein
MLLYKDGNFMQALEGDMEVVTKLAGTIERDLRHKGVLILSAPMSGVFMKSM